MSGIADSNVIDLVATDADDRCLVVMVEERPWGATPEQAQQLIDKINTYVGWILDGDLVREYPLTNGKPVVIRLACVEPPVGHFAHIVDHAVLELDARGIGFEVHISKPNVP